MTKNITKILAIIACALAIASCGTPSSQTPVATVLVVVTATPKATATITQTPTKVPTPTSAPSCPGDVAWICDYIGPSAYSEDYELAKTAGLYWQNGGHINTPYTIAKIKAEMAKKGRQPKGVLPGPTPTSAFLESGKTPPSVAASTIKSFAPTQTPTATPTQTPSPTPTRDCSNMANAFRCGLINLGVWRDWKGVAIDSILTKSHECNWMVSEDDLWKSFQEYYGGDTNKFVAGMYKLLNAVCPTPTKQPK